MRIPAGAWMTAAAWMVAGCGISNPRPAEKKAEKAAPLPKITQFYASPATLQRGDKGTLCYGVENAVEVWIFPPRQILTPSLSRCIEVAPATTTTYRLTAQGADTQTVTQDVTVEMGAPKAHIIEVRVSALEAKRGDTVSLCYGVLNTRSVTIDPIGFKAGDRQTGCTTLQPRETTTYVVTALGANGDSDTEKITIKVR
jgi:hypothetical protein